MGVRKYSSRGKTYYRVDSWLTRPDGTLFRFRQGKIPSKEMAEALLAKAKAQSFEGRFFDKRKERKHTVAALLDTYLPISRRDKRSWRDDVSRAAHLKRHLGDRVAQRLTQRDVDEYRTLRLAETTQRDGAPSPATLDRELALLKHAFSYAVQCGELDRNPVATVALLNVPNTRDVIVDDATFDRILAAAAPELRPAFRLAYDTGMRKDEVRLLTWKQVDLASGVIRLSHDDTKTATARQVCLTEVATVALKEVPRHLASPHVFVSPRTARPWSDLLGPFQRACEAAGVAGVWFHDLRRSFVTNARRRGVAESVVMKMSGHRTRAVFDRYNVVDAADVRAAVALIEAARRKETELAPAAAGR
jgi:integrase